MVEFSELLSVLDFDTMKTLKLRKKGQRIANLLYLSDPVSSVALISPETICFGDASQFNAIGDRHLTHGTFVLHLDEPIKPLPADVTVITFASLSEMRECYNQLSNEMRLYRRIKDRIFDLTLLVSRGVGLKALLNRISDIFEVPCNVLDNSLSIVSRSDYFPTWVSDGHSGENTFLPERAVAAMKAEGLVARQQLSEPRVFSWHATEDGSLCFNHFAPISIGDTVIASLSLFTQLKPMRKSRIDLLPGIAHILSIEMQKSNVYLMNKSVYYSHLFTDLINGSIDEDPDTLRYRFSVFGYSLRPYKRIVFADLSREQMDSSQIQSLAERLHKVLDNNIYVVTTQGIILLTSRNTFIDDGFYCDKILPDDIVTRGLSSTPRSDIEPESRSDQDTDDPLLIAEERLDLCELADVVRGTQVKIGVSSIFTDILHAPSYFVQAQRAISSGMAYDREGPVYFFANFRMADMVSHIEDQKALFALRYPPLMHVIREDLQHGTNLAYTLFVYLQNPSHPAEACEKLFIHKNTLYYRLDRIRQLMGVDIKNGWVITQVEMTFLILKHQGKFEQLVLPKDSSDADAGGQDVRKRRKRGRKARTDVGTTPKPQPVVNKIVEFEKDGGKSPAESASTDASADAEHEEDPA